MTAPLATHERSTSRLAVLEAAVDLLRDAAVEANPARWAEKGLATVSRAMGFEFAALVHGSKGSWRVLASHGNSREVPNGLIGEAVDTGEACRQGDWYVVPLDSSGVAGEAVAAYRPARMEAGEMIGSPWTVLRNTTI